MKNSIEVTRSIQPLNKCATVHAERAYHLEKREGTEGTRQEGHLQGRFLTVKVRNTMSV